MTPQDDRRCGQYQRRRRYSAESSAASRRKCAEMTSTEIGEETMDDLRPAINPPEPVQSLKLARTPKDTESVQSLSLVTDATVCDVDVGQVDESSGSNGS